MATRSPARSTPRSDQIMTSAPTPAPDAPVIAPGTLPRLMPLVAIRDLATHLATYGPLPASSSGLIAAVSDAGVIGRGGSGFPTGTKMAAVAKRGRRPVVVANGTEGEPASLKDRTLMLQVPHLVFDGVSVAASALDAVEAIVCIDSAHGQVASVMADALAQRVAARIDRIPIRIELSPNRYVAGEETALIHWINGGDAKPTATPPRPFEKGVKGKPTLLDNVETLADVALVARFGASWYRSLGGVREPGSLLTTISGGVATAGVYEVATNTTLAAALEHAGADLSQVSALLVGGYFGTWIPTFMAAQLTFTHESLRAIGGSIGCGAVFALPNHVCGLAETARITRWLADQNAGQCGPCVNGLPAIADALEHIVGASLNAAMARDRLNNLFVLVEGRGGCRHPDGVVRMVRSALATFATDIDRHIAGAKCASAPAMLPTPITGGWR